jgi:hypothetical protein
MLSVVALWAIFLLVGCGGGASQAEHDHAPQKKSATLDLRPEHDSGVSGTVSFGDISEGVIVKLELRGLPKPDAFYLAHIHPGTCAEAVAGGAEEQGARHEDEHDHAEPGAANGGEIEHPLSQVRSDSEGSGSSTTTLRDTSLAKLFSGGAKHVNVHAAGSGDPPILSCAELRGAE